MSLYLTGHPFQIEPPIFWILQTLSIAADCRRRPKVGTAGGQLYCHPLHYLACAVLRVFCCGSDSVYPYPAGNRQLLEGKWGTHSGNLGDHWDNTCLFVPECIGGEGNWLCFAGWFESGAGDESDL